MNRTIGIVTTNFNCPGLCELVERRTPASVPFGGRYRLVDFSLSNMVNSGITTVGMVSPYYYRSLLDHVGAGKEWDLNRKEGGLFYLPGTVFGFKEEGSRFLFRDIIHNKTYLERGDGDYLLVAAGDNIYNIDYRPMIERHEMEGKPVTLLCRRSDGSRRSWYMDLGPDGRVKSLSRTRGEYEFINSFIIDKSFFLRLIRDFRTLGYMDIMALLAQELDSCSIGSFLFEGYVGRTDTIAEYMQTSRDLLKSEVRRDLFPRDRQIHTRDHDTPPALYVPGAAVSNSIVTAGCIIEGTVEGSIVSRSARIEAGAVVRNCVLMDKCVVRAGAVLENVVCDKKVTVSQGVHITGSAETPLILPRSEIV